VGFRGIVAWARWELSRRITLTLGLRLIILDRAAKALVLTLGGVALLVAVRSGALEDWADRLQTELNVHAGSGVWLRLTGYTVGHFTTLGKGTQVAVAVAAFLYGLLEAVEAVALILRRRWAEYLVLFASCAFIPVEIEELLRHPGVLKGLAFLVNVVIVVYLVRRKRLFLDRPPATAPAVDC